MFITIVNYTGDKLFPCVKGTSDRCCWHWWTHFYPDFYWSLVPIIRKLNVSPLFSDSNWLCRLSCLLSSYSCCPVSPHDRFPASPAYCPAPPARCPASPAFCLATPARCLPSAARCSASTAHCPVPPTQCPASTAHCPDSWSCPSTAM